MNMKKLYIVPQTEVMQLKTAELMGLTDGSNGTLPSTPSTPGTPIP